jgi:hypothetical protein
VLVVVGGHSRNIGKTSVAAGIISAIPQAEWTAVKITQHGHGICSEVGTPCDCAIETTHPFAITEEAGPGSTDSGRFKAAGAAHSYWLRTRAGELGHAMGEVRRLLAQSANTILESNSVLNFLRADLYLFVLDYAVRDVKDSARRFLKQADALVITGGAHSGSLPQVPERWLSGKPVFPVNAPEYASSLLTDFVRLRLHQAQGKLR